MQLSINTQRPYAANYSAPQQNKLQCCKPKPQSFTGSKEEIISSMASKSKFFEPVEKAWDTMTDWIAKNIIGKAMNSDIVAKFANKTENSKYITNHIITAGAAVGTGMYMYKTMNLPDDKMDKDRKKVLTLNHALTFAISTAGSYLADGMLFGKWREVTNKYAELYTKDKDLLSKIETINKDLKAKGKNTIDLIDYANDYLKDKKLVNRLKGMDIAKTFLICTMIYRYIVPVAVTPLANKLGDKFLASKKEQDKKLQNAA